MARLGEDLTHDARRRVLQQRVARLVGEECEVPRGAHLVSGGWWLVGVGWWVVSGEGCEVSGG